MTKEDIMPTLESVEKLALELPKDEQRLLAEKLFSRLNMGTMSDVDEAWIEEIERRYDDYKNGRTQAIHASRVFDDIKKGMGWTK